MILDEMRTRFLIIGLTGPLRSGVTTAAKYLENNLKERIQDCVEKAKEFENKIWQKYEILKHDKDSSVDYSILAEERRELLSDIKARQILKSLKKYKSDLPRYISLTDML